ncbi:hypothetical protein SKAU_G00019830 [Synaphobranchus kaupii]|uniref:Uncharacterized protein n=1 Tax=Synaphobranchus kaupii TaxID=118154 RepID=A0A9Q1GCV3_SYNKA|nr:hypothetical protein SKAU_G00019830 [Synaphobranchus kaupii]
MWNPLLQSSQLSQVRRPSNPWRQNLLLQTQQPSLVRRPSNPWRQNLLLQTQQPSQVRRPLNPWRQNLLLQTQQPSLVRRLSNPWRQDLLLQTQQPSLVRRPSNPWRQNLLLQTQQPSLVRRPSNPWGQNLLLQTQQPSLVESAPTDQSTQAEDPTPPLVDFSSPPAASPAAESGEPLSAAQTEGVCSVDSPTSTVPVMEEIGGLLRKSRSPIRAVKRPREKRSRKPTPGRFTTPLALKVSARVLSCTPKQDESSQFSTTVSPSLVSPPPSHTCKLRTHTSSRESARAPFRHQKCSESSDGLDAYERRSAQLPREGTKAKTGIDPWTEMRRAWLRGIHVRKKQDDRMPPVIPDPQRHKCNRTHTLPREASLSDCRQQSTQLDPSSRSQNGFRQGKRCFPAHQ